MSAGFQEKAQAALRRHDALRRKFSQPTAETVGCLACRWAARRALGQEPQAYGMEIIKCGGVASGTLYPILARLEKTGAIVANTEEIDSRAEGRPPRVYYQPADTSVGRDFSAAIEVPELCGLGKLEEDPELAEDQLKLF